MAVVSDIDGTLLNYGNIPIKSVIAYVNKQDTVYIITARPESRRAETVAALKKAGVHYSRLLMNNEGPSKMDGMHSKMINIKSLSNVTEAIDNDPAVRRMYSSLGIKVTDPRSVNKSVWAGFFR